MLKPREIEPEDPQRIVKCHNLLVELVKTNPGCPGAIWISSYFTVIATSFHESGGTYEQFCDEMNRARRHFKKLWKKQ